jgi:hypothetical protein
VALTAEQTLARLRQVAERGLVNGASTLDLALLLRFLVSSGVSPGADVRSCSACGNDQIYAGTSFREGDAPAATVPVSVAAKLLSLSEQRVRRLARMGRFGAAGRGPRRVWRIPRDAVEAERDRRRRVT